jgi:hypothetical protein
VKFAFEAIATLPGLAWCARSRRGAEEVAVRHGRWVEARGDWFVEGAWDGPFEQGRFDRAETQVGTGGRTAEHGVTFAASSNFYDRLYLMRREDELLISNSLVFLLVEAGGGLDPDCLYYPGEFLLNVLRGIRRSRRSLPARPAPVEIHECGNLEVAPDLSLQRREKPVPRQPAEYDDYVGLVRDAIAGVLANAADPQRARRYRALTTLSRGYDSGAVAALARTAGCSEAATFAESTPGNSVPEDNGKAIGLRLGMHVAEYARNSFAGRRDLPEAEFCACPPGIDVPLMSMEEQLRGKVLLTGRFGDDIWTGDAATILPDLRQHSIAGLGGTASTEFRLRVGYLHFPPLFTGHQHIAAVHAIATAPAMRPWSLGGSYDRPIARRILEEAGVPRELFGQKKDVGKGGYALKSADDLSEVSREDFLQFCSEGGPTFAARHRMHLLRSLFRLNRRVNQRIAALARRLGWSLRLSSLLSSRYAFRPSHNQLFFWGFDRIKDRYRVPEAPRDAAPSGTSGERRRLG